MKPKIFPEQVKDLKEPQAPSMSLQQYKIDYSQFLGSGSYGNVYALVQRPDNEKGLFSYFFPYLYDTLFPLQGLAPSKYCIKISESSFEIGIRAFIRNSSTLSTLKLLINNFFEKKIQNDSHQLRAKFGISNIMAYPTNSRYSQIKTRVYGKTFFDYMEQGAFSVPKNYEMRKAFVCFLWNIVSAPLNLFDLNFENIMYDEKNKQWEIVDGRTIESTSRSPSERFEMAKFIVKSLLDDVKEFSSSVKINKSANCVRMLAAFALKNIPYTAEADQKILHAISRPNEFHVLRPKDRKDKFDQNAPQISHRRSRSLTR